jgi:hypothetical protein
LKKITAIVLVVALLATFIAVPLVTFTPQIYGRPNVTLGDLNFIKDYIVSWWQKAYRRYILGQVGPAENATVNQQQAQQYQLPQTKTTDNPQTPSEVINSIRKNSATLSVDLIAYLEANGLPNRSMQLDLLVVPDNIYVTIVWNEVTLIVYDGWQTDIGCREWVEAVATSDVIMQLWQNKDNVEAARGIILDAERTGELSYSLHRVNPITAEMVMWLDVAASLISLFGWSYVLLVHYKVGRKVK